MSKQLLKQLAEQAEKAIEKEGRTNTGFHYALLDDNDREIAAFMLLTDAIRAGNALAKAAGHRDFSIMSLFSRTIENWRPE